jgi:O-antigen ligase
MGIGKVQTLHGDAIHNLFLSSWAEAGIFTFLSAFLFYLGLIFCWLGAWPILRPGGPAERMGISGAWTFVLMVLPLFRAWIAGDGGQFTGVSWAFVAVFLALVTQCRRDVRRQSEPGAPRSPELGGARAAEAVLSPGQRF